MIALLLLLVGCPEPKADTGEPATCEDLTVALAAEEAEIRACTSGAECGQVLSGTSCGCTRNEVARYDADTTAFYALLSESQAAECDLGASTCDCPEAYGFACESGTCTWNYTDSSAGLPDCHASDGFATTVTAASVTGDTLTVAVEYGGGCETHEFALCWPDGTFMESAPVQVSLELWHGGIPDACEAWISEDRTFDLAPLKAAWQAAYRQTSGTIVIHIAGQTVDYTF